MVGSQPSEKNTLFLWENEWFYYGGDRDEKGVGGDVEEEEEEDNPPRGASETCITSRRICPIYLSSQALPVNEERSLFQCPISAYKTK